MSVRERLRTHVGDVDHWYCPWGDQTGTPVVLVPGLTDGLAPLSRPGTVERLATVPLHLEQVRALAVSYADPLPTSCTTQALAADLGYLLEDLLDMPAVLVAHSMGGMVAQHLAAVRPELVRGMVLSATSGRADEQVCATLGRWDALLAAGEVTRFSWDAIERSFTGAERRRRHDRLRVEGVDDEPHGYVARHLRLSAACATHDATDRLGDITAPTLVLAAAQDRVIPADHARRLADAIPQAIFHLFADHGHGFPEQDPAAYRREVEPFIAELTGSRSD